MKENLKEKTMPKMLTVTYKTVTNGYDWGPAINKIVLDMGTTVDSNTVTPQSFDVTAIRSYNDLNVAIATDHVVSRNVIKAYTSDSFGEVNADSQFVTLEFEIGPSMPESSPFYYNVLTGRNEYVKTFYEVSVAIGSTLASTDGHSLTFKSTGKAEKIGDIQPSCDAFVHNQEFEMNHVKLKYASFTPTIHTMDNTPLIIWLHGAGEGGLDTTIAVLGNNVSNLIKENIQSNFGKNGAFVLVPQAPTMWMDFDGKSIYNNTVDNSDGHSFYEESLMGLIEHFVAMNPTIDAKRIYIGGCSNGGYMTVKMVMDHPDYFAAAFPAAEAYSVDWLTEERIDAIKHFPMWLTHAQNDPIVEISRDHIPLDNYSNALFDRLVASGNKNVHYSLFNDVVDTSGIYFDADGKPFAYHGHWSWIYTLNNYCKKTINGKEITLFEWLSEQKKI